MLSHDNCCAAQQVCKYSIIVRQLGQRHFGQSRTSQASLDAALLLPELHGWLCLSLGLSPRVSAVAESLKYTARHLGIQKPPIFANVRSTLPWGSELGSLRLWHGGLLVEVNLLHPSCAEKMPFAFRCRRTVLRTLVNVGGHIYRKKVQGCQECTLDIWQSTPNGAHVRMLCISVYACSRQILSVSGDFREEPFATPLRSIETGTLSYRV